MKVLLCQIGRNNARQYDAIEGACTSDTNDANFAGFDILEMHEIGADEGPTTPIAKATGAATSGARSRAKLTATMGEITPGMAMPMPGTGRAIR